MQYSGEQHPGTMAAIIGLSTDIVIEVCQEAQKEDHVQPANYNSPGQIVISGSIVGVHRAIVLAKERGARMVTELVVSGAFHSPLMQEAVSGLTQALDKANIIDPKIQVFSNVTANPVKSANEVKDMLKKQLLSPVMWQNIIENMAQNGIETFYEVGPSKVLNGLNKRINKDLESTSIGTREDLSLIDKGEY
jgi:[acyl-carrier-protein] S-malonyltransferase